MQPHPAPEIRSVGLVLLAAPNVLEASPVLHSQPSPPGSGPAVPAWGIGLPSPAGLCVGANTEQAPSLDVLKVSSSRSLHDWRATRCPQVSTSFPRGAKGTHQKASLARVLGILADAIINQSPDRCTYRIRPSRPASLQSTSVGYIQQPHH